MFCSGSIGKEHSYFIAMQDDGHLVIYGIDSDGKQQIPAKWESNRVKVKGNYIALFGDDGNFQIYPADSDWDKSGNPIWGTDVGDPIVSVEKIFSITYKDGKATDFEIDSVDHANQVNESSIEQEMEISRQTEVSQSSIWSLEMGYEISVSESITVGIPALEAGEIQTSEKFTTSFQFGETETITKVFGWTVKPKVPANSVLTVVIHASHATVATNFELDGKLKLKSGLILPGKLYGSYKGTQYSDFSVVYEQGEIPPINGIFTDSKLTQKASLANLSISR